MRILLRSRMARGVDDDAQGFTFVIFPTRLCQLDHNACH